MGVRSSFVSPNLVRDSTKKMLRVKTGVSDHQQAPPSYHFAILSKDAGLAWNRLLDQELHTM